MHIIIDGCNVLRSGRNSGPVSDRRKEEFVYRLARYSRSKKHTITLVFDGGFASRPEYVVSQGIVVWHAGRESSADDVVKRLLNEVEHPGQSLLVSSDRELNDYAEGRSIVSVDSAVFSQCIFSALQSQKAAQPKKQASDYVVFNSSNSELDQLMIEASQKMFDKDSYAASRQQASGEKFSTGTLKKIPRRASGKSKIERRLLRILEQL